MMQDKISNYDKPLSAEEHFPRTDHEVNQIGKILNRFISYYINIKTHENRGILRLEALTLKGITN